MDFSIMAAVLLSRPAEDSMKSRLTILAIIGLLLSLITMSDRADAQQPPAAAQHQGHDAHLAAMKAFDAKLADLLKKMNGATGQAKTDAMAELLTAIVEHHQTMCAPMMAEMMSKMK
jgi:hypothetical protein